MHRLGIFTGADLRRQSLAFLQQHFGKSGPWFHAIANGEDRRPVVPDRPRKSSGSETTFSNDLTGPEAAARRPSLGGLSVSSSPAPHGQLFDGLKASRQVTDLDRAFPSRCSSSGQHRPSRARLEQPACRAAAARRERQRLPQLGLEPSAGRGRQR